MQIKLIVCAVMLAAMGLAGASIGSAYRRRARALAQVIAELQLLEEQVRIGRPVAEALSQKEMRIFGAMQQYIEAQGIAGAWEQICKNADEKDPISALEAPERRILGDFWAEMGALNRRNQLSRFADTEESLHVLQKQAAEDAAQHSRLYGSLGVLLGLSAVVLLW